MAIYDDFNDNYIDPDKWLVTAGVTETNQRLQVVGNAVWDTRGAVSKAIALYRQDNNQITFQVNSAAATSLLMSMQTVNNALNLNHAGTFSLFFTTAQDILTKTNGAAGVDTGYNWAASTTYTVTFKCKAGGQGWQVYINGGAFTNQLLYDGGTQSDSQYYFAFQVLTANTAWIDNVDFPAITVTSISPTVWNNDNTCAATITGINFVSGATVKLTKFGDTDISGTSVVVVNSTTITCNFALAGKNPGAWTVRVTNPNLQYGELANALTIYDNLTPTVLSVSPDAYDNGGSCHIVNLSGDNFFAGAYAKLIKAGQSDISATNVVITGDYQIVCDFNLTGAATGTWTLRVFNVDGAYASLTDGFTISAVGNTKRIKTNGDSIMRGYVAPSTDSVGMRARFQDDLGIGVYAFVGQYTTNDNPVGYDRETDAVSGQYTSTLNDLIDDELDTYLPSSNGNSYVVIHSGTAALFGGGQSPETILTSYQGVLDKIHAHDSAITIFVCMPIPNQADDLTKPYALGLLLQDEVNTRRATKSNIYLVNCYWAIKQETDWEDLFYDDRHMLIAGYHLAGKAISHAFFGIAGPEIYSCDPVVGPGIITVNIVGKNFKHGMDIWMSKTGETDIHYTSIYVSSSSRVSVEFDVSTAENGLWNLNVAHPEEDLDVAVLSDAFEISNINVDSITPDTTVVGAVKRFTITGVNFVSGIAISLTKTGESDINATNVVVASSTSLSCTIDLRTAVDGSWNVKSSYSGNISILTNGLTLNYLEDVSIKNIVNHTDYGNAKLVRSTTPANALTVDGNGKVANNDKSEYTLTSAYDSAKTAASQSSVNSIPTNPLLTNDSRLNNLDATISSRSTLTAQGVWEYTTRTISSFGTLVADIALAVWSYTTRILTGNVNINSNDDITAIKNKTDNLPANPAAVSDIPTANDIDTVLTNSHGSGSWQTGGGGGGGGLTQQEVRDAMKLAPSAGEPADGSIDDLISEISSGVGAIEWDYVITDSGTGLPIADVIVWVTTDVNGSNIVASGTTNNFGTVTFYLDAGIYYIWRKKAKYNFANPDQETVS